MCHNLFRIIVYSILLFYWAKFFIKSVRKSIQTSHTRRQELLQEFENFMTVPIYTLY